MNMWVPTRYGSVCLTKVDSNHIFLCCNPTKEDVRHVVVNGVEYSVSAHYHLYDSGQWRLGPQFRQNGEAYLPYERMQYFHSYRLGTCDSMTSSAKHKMIAELDRVVNEWAKTNQVLLTQAKVSELKAAYREKLTETSEVKERLRDLNAQVWQASEACLANGVASSELLEIQRAVYEEFNPVTIKRDTAAS